MARGVASAEAGIAEHEATGSSSESGIALRRARITAFEAPPASRGGALCRSGAESAFAPGAHRWLEAAQ